MRTIISAIACLLVTGHTLAQQIRVNTSAQGDIDCIQVAGDPMNWILKTDGTQYPWVTERYRWGRALGLPEGVAVAVSRKQKGDDVVETYTFRNTSSKAAELKDVSICTPWNDNYPDAATCMTSRCNAHIWAGGENTWVKLMRMSGQGPHMGLVLTRGAIDGYEVWERDGKKGSSNFRGVIAMRLPQMTLKRGQTYTLEWMLFSHCGTDFDEQLLRRGGIVVSSAKYVYEVGQTASVTFRKGSQTKTVSRIAEQPGEMRISCKIGGRTAYACLLAVSSEQLLIDRRARFIVEHQQMQNPMDPRFGAYMVYDCEGDSIETDHHNRADLDEGRERLGMGIFLAEYYKTSPSRQLLRSLERYAHFLRDKLQDDTYMTKSSLLKQSKNRGYNYPWVADFYFRMYDITHEQHYARDGYATMLSLFRMFKHNFYCIDYPVSESLLALRHAGLTAEADTLLGHYRLTADEFCSNGLHFPKSEVNYEQAIIAPAMQYLCEMYLETHDERYFDVARQMLPPVAALNAHQPDYHQNDIAIRHWDGFWFGKHRLWGDVYPHYWSTITAGAFHYYAKCLKTKGQTSEADYYQHRAENIVRNNLCLFYEDGKATCAYVLPDRINGEPGRHGDAYANDQDFALMYYLLVNGAQGVLY